MRGFLHLVRRDLVQRTPLFLASLAMGLLILALPYFPNMRATPTELRGAAGLAIAFSWCTILAILLGGSIFTRDLAEGRLAFDFRLPVLPGTIWAARFLAANFTLVFAAVLVFGPPALAGADGLGVLLDNPLSHSRGGGLLAVSLLVLVVLVVSNPVALGSRTRQGWLAVDLIAFTTLIAAAFWSVQLLCSWGAVATLRTTGALLAGAVAIAGAVTSARQVRLGRTEIDKAQKALSLGLLFSSFAIAGSLLVFANWLTHPPIEALPADNSTALGLGSDWVVVGGYAPRAPDILSRFLLQPSTGRSLGLGPMAIGPPSDYFSNAGAIRNSVVRSLDGSTIVLWERDPALPATRRLHVLNPRADALIPIATSITAGPSAERWALAPSGKSIAILERTGSPQDPKRIVVSAIPSGAIETSILLTACQAPGDLLYASSHELFVQCDAWPGRARTEAERTWMQAANGENVGRILRINLDAKTLASDELVIAGKPIADLRNLMRGPSGWFLLEKDPASPQGRTLRVVDLESGRSVMTLTPPKEIEPSALARSGQLLRDGRLAVAWNDPGGSKLLIFDGNGNLKRTVPIAEKVPSWILAEGSDSHLLIASRLPGYDQGWDVRRNLSIVGIDTGIVSRLPSFFYGSEENNRSVSRTVLFASHSTSQWFNPASNTLQPLLNGSR
ncbi:MAG: hypothetical protein ABI639_00900 [Thermoanaerobaculia bacterium]